MTAPAFADFAREVESLRIESATERQLLQEAQASLIMLNGKVAGPHTRRSCAIRAAAALITLARNIELALPQSRLPDPAPCCPVVTASKDGRA